MHMWRRRDARMRYSVAYPMCAERCRESCQIKGMGCFDKKGLWRMVERCVGELKAAGAGFSAGVPVKFQCGCDCTDQGVCANECINELYQRFNHLKP